MPADAPLVPSGIGPVEVVWGGFARPGAYLLIGSARNGRHHLAAQAAGGAVAAGERVLLFSGREPEAVAGAAREAGVDLADAYRRGLARLLRVPPTKDLAALGEAGLQRALTDIGAAAKGSARVVIEDFTPFVQFRSLDGFTAAFRKLVADVAQHGATLVLGLGEPANEGSQRLLALVQAEVTGALQLRAEGGGVLLAMRPGRGHAGQAHESAWSPTAAPAPEPFSLFAEVALAPDDPAPAPAAPAPAPAFPAFEEEAELYPEASSDGYAGTRVEDLDAGALVATGQPREPFGPAAGPADPAALGLTRAAAPDPFAAGAFVDAPEEEAAAPAAAAADPFGDDPFAQDPFAGDAYALPEEADVVAPAAPEAAPAPIAEVPTVEAEVAPMPEPEPFAVPDAAPMAAPSSDGAAWDVELATLAPVAIEPMGPVVIPPGLDPMGAGYLVDSDVAGIAPDVQANPWAAEGGDAVPALPAMAAAPMVAAPAMAPLAPAPPAPPPMAAAPDDSPEAAFREDLAAAFAARAQTPFLVLAARIDPASGFAAAFPSVADGLLGGLTANDRALVRDDDARLVALLPGAGPDAPQRLLAAVHAHLATVRPADADVVLRAVGVLALPDGQPFTTPDELLAYALG